VFKALQALMVPREQLALVLQELLERQVLTEPLVLKVQQAQQGPELRELQELLGLVLTELLVLQVQV